MKKFLIFVFCFWIISSIHLNAYEDTGHEGFLVIEFTNEGSKLLVDMTNSELDKGYQAMGSSRFFGWKHHLFVIREEAYYIGEVIFARTNRTNQKVSFEYKLKEVSTTARSVKTSGNLSGTFSTKLKKSDIGAKGGFDVEVKKDTSYSKTEDTAFTIVVQPYYRVTFRVTGQAIVTNGVSKYYVLGMTVNKGAWEYIDVVTRYYELFEEKL